MKRLPILRLLVSALTAVLVIGVYLEVSSCSGLVLPVPSCYMLRTPLLRMRPIEALPDFADPITLSTATVPEGSDPQGYIIRERPPVDPSSLRVSIDETWDESIIGVEEATLFQVAGDERFRAMLTFAPNLEQPIDFLLACLVDLKQVPCTPGTAITQTIPLRGSQPITIPLDFHALEPGIHDVAIPLWSDAYAGRGDPDEETRRVFTQRAIRFSLIAGHDFAAITYPTQEMPEPFPALGLDGIALHPNASPWERDGGFTDQTHLRATPGAWVSTYLHVFNKQPKPVEYGIVAFVDYVQQDIRYDDVTQRVLSVVAAPEAWYPVPISIRSPKTPGHYELVLLAQPYPRARMDMNAAYEELVSIPLDVLFWSTSRIDLEVSP